MPYRRLVTLLVLTGATILGPQPKAQPGADAADVRQLSPDTFYVFGNLEFILLHELAHLLISDLDIPIIGPEESAADYIAAGMLIRADRFDDATAERARQFLFATANGLASSWDFRAGAGADIHYWGSHALTIQRYYQIICLIYGSDPGEFTGLPERVGMPETRAALCANEFARADRSLQWLLENYGRATGDPAGAAVDLVFEQAPTRVSRRIADELMADGMLDRTIDRLHELFTIREPFRIAFRGCRDPQAAWLPASREIAVCYALLDAYYSLGRSRNASRRRLELAPQ